MIDNNPAKRTIIEIPAVKCAEKLPFSCKSKRKVGAYARVSTEKNMQCSSYEA